MKSFTSIVKIQYSGNQHWAKSKEEYIKLLKAEYIEYYDIELEDHEITGVEELVVGEEEQADMDELEDDIIKSSLGHGDRTGYYNLTKFGNWK